MQGIGRHQNGVFHALDFDIHIGSHAGQHAGYLIQGDNSGVGTVRGGLVNFRHNTGEGVFCDRADRNIGFLSQIQCQNITFVHADGDRNLLVGRQDGKLRNGDALFFCSIQIRNRVETTCHGRGDAAVLLNAQQIQQCFLGLASFPEQGIKVGAVLGVLQGK